jgi:uncharacterized coiled-coil DUF342 family protein
MKKAFDANVSRARPKLRLGAMLASEAPQVTAEEVESLAQAVAQEPVIPSRDLSSAVKARLRDRVARPSAVEALTNALQVESVGHAEAVARVAPPTPPERMEPPASGVPAEFARPAALARDLRDEVIDHGEASSGHDDVGAPRSASVEQAARVVDPFTQGTGSVDGAAAPIARSGLTSPSASAVSQSRITVEAVMPQPRTVVQSVRSAVEAPAEVREVQTAPSELPAPDAGDRRERLRERLKAVRENPRPEPLPETVAEAGVLAVERIAALQTELTKTRAMNLALSQDLEAARRQAERATEEARLRMDEARRLSAEMEGRAQLLADLEKELSSLEGERNEALLALQEARASIEASEREKLELQEALTGKDEELEASLQEEERLASELEAAHEAMTGLRRSADALKGERDTLARQVSDLTKERAELLEARKALEAVHRALAKASAVA